MDCAGETRTPRPKGIGRIQRRQFIEATGFRVQRCLRQHRFRMSRQLTGLTYAVVILGDIRHEFALCAAFRQARGGNLCFDIAELLQRCF